MAQVFPLHIDTSAAEDGEESLAATLAALPDPWTLLLDRHIGDAERSIDVVLVHPEIGVALVAEAPADPSGGVAALSAYLGSERFGEFFAGELPIVALTAARDELSTIGERLEAAFAAAPPLSIEDRDWADAVIELLLTPDDLAMAPTFGRSAPPEEPPPLGDFAGFDDRFRQAPAEHLDAPLPLAVDWPFGSEDREPRRRGWALAASVAFLMLLGGAGFAAWSFNSEQEQLAEIAPAAPRQVEVPMPPADNTPAPQSAATPTAAGAQPPPPPPAASPPAHPPVTLAAKPFAPAPPTPPTPSHVAPLPTAVAKAEPPPTPAAAPPPASMPPIEQAQSNETPAPTPPPGAPKAIAANDVARNIPPAKPPIEQAQSSETPAPTPPPGAPKAIAASKTTRETSPAPPNSAAAPEPAHVAAAAEPPAPATEAAPPPPPPAKPKPSRIAKSEPAAPKRIAKATRNSPHAEATAHAPKRVANARPEEDPSDHPPFDAADLPPLEGKLTPPPQEAAPSQRRSGEPGAELRDASNAGIGRPTPLFGLPARAVAPAREPAVPQMASASTGQRECRPYTSERTLTGRGLPVQGIACRDPDGQWRLVSEVPLR